jgi:hypothetical protein
MLKRLKRLAHELADGTPGRRFVDHHARSRRERSVREAPWKRAAVVVIASLLFLVGILLSIPPGLPGFLLWVPALSMLVARSRPFAVALDRAELLIRRCFGLRK